jgi:hypothetical protein
MTGPQAPETPADRHLRLVHEQPLEPERPDAAPTPEPSRPAGVPLWLRFKRLTQLGWPRSFPLVQFPNAPLIIAFLAGMVAGVAHGPAHADASAIAYLAMTIWAYEELIHGVNWFRHLLGLTYMISTVVHLALALHH